jgi:LPXTG-motif cell wall-anchored protein
MKKKILSMALSCSILFNIFTLPLSAKAETLGNEVKGTTYYVSTLDGSDNNDGLSENKAFYSLQKINEIELNPGDRVLLEAGSVFTNGFLHIKGSGSEEAPIEIDKYGEGSNPIINTNGQGIWYQDYGKPLDSSSHKLKGYVSSSILLYDVEYINIRNLEITNESLEIDAKYNYLHTMNRTGVAAVAQNKGTIDHIYLDGLNIHDVIGNVYDKHMNNGGIYFTVFKPKNEVETGISRYNDIKIENCIVDNVNRWGIAVGYTAYWDKFTAAVIPDETIAKYGSTKVEIRNNYIKDAGGDAITTMYCDRPIIEYNVSDGIARQINTTDYSETGSGRVAAAIWPWKCKDAIFQYNEAFDTCLNQDGQAWDADYGDGTIYQYNYSHNNGGGAVMICGIDAINTIFRYNISENDLGGVLNIPGNPRADIYNNTFYMKEGIPFIRPGMAGGVAVIENNIIYNAGAEKTEDWTRGNSKVTYSHNLYYNYSNLPIDNAAITSDPKFVNAGNGPTQYTGITPSSDKRITHDLSKFEGYELQNDSPAINTGKFITNNGGFDFFGNKVAGTPDIGAYESNVASLEVYSSIYQVNNENFSISGTERNILVKDFLKNLSYDDDVTLVIKNVSGKTLGENDIVTGGSKITLSANGKTKVYTISANEDNSIKDSIYMIKESGKILYIPSVENNPTKVQEVIQGITVHSTATIKIFNGTSEVKDGSISDGMTLKVIAENGAENVYTINVKNSYQWALDYTGKQGNVWFAQKKVNGIYSNLTSYDTTYPQWNGNNYGGVGIDSPNHSTIPSEITHGLLVDTLGTSGREQGHSMVYRVPKSGTIILSVKDNEPYLRQAGNSGGKVKLSFTHNGEEISSYELTQSLTKINVESITINVQKGDFIRVEAQNIDNPTRPSIHITPKVEYQNIAITDTEAPTIPMEIKTDNITQNSVDISWKASTDNIGVVRYEIYNGDILISTVSDETSVKLTGLTAETEYTLSIKAFDEAGNKSEAGRITFITPKIPEEPVEADKTLLELVIGYAEDVKAEGALENVVPAVVQEFEAALQEAKAILADKNATEVAVDLSTNRLVNVIHMLDFKKADKAELIKLVEIINALDESKYTSSTWEELQVELLKANEVIANENAMEEEVAKAYEDLNKAFSNLELEVSADKSKLQQLVSEIKLKVVDMSKFTPGTSAKFNLVLKNAMAVLNNQEATQEEINEVYNSLMRAYLDLRLIPDKSKLEELVNKAKAVDISKFTVESANVLVARLSNARTVLNNEETTQKEVDEAVKELELALNSLEVKPNNNDNGSGDRDKTEEESKNGTISNSDLPNTGGSSPIATGLLATLISIAGVVILKRKK